MFASKQNPYLIKPKFIHDLQDYPIIDPILIAVDGQSCHFIQRLKGVCLLCDEYNANYDSSFCFFKEVWVLYSKPQQVDLAMCVARKIQFAGAEKTIVILINL